MYGIFLARAAMTAAVLAISVPASAQDFDPSMAWPLCGRIVEDPSESWDATSNPDCPSYRHGDPAYADFPIRSTFGPRPLSSEGGRYDFHRGLDIATPIGTPVFAVADGFVRHAGPHSSYSDPVIIVRHYRPGETSCSPTGCYHANYLHMSGWLNFAANEPVTKGQLLGFTGESHSGFDHLHFEIRSAPPEDPFSSWQRDAVHPMGVLPNVQEAPATVAIENVDQTDPANPVATVSVTTTRSDVLAMDLTLYDATGAVIPQPGDAPDPIGYNVHPAFFDLNVWNRQWTHKNSSSFPWSAFGAGGALECPFHADHGSSYSAHVHMDQQAADDFEVGHFNGVRIETQSYYSGTWWMRLTFEELTGPAACIEATATMTDGSTHFAEWGSCGGPGGNQPPVAEAQSVQTSKDTPVDITLSATDPDGDAPTFAIVGQPQNGALSGAGAAQTYTPDTGFTGADSFIFSATDPEGASDQATVSINVKKGKGGGGGGGGNGGGGNGGGKGKNK